MTIQKLRDLVADDFDAVNRLIIEHIQTDVGLIDELSEYIVASGGKRVRPLLLLLASKACGYEGEHHVTLAAVVEFFHTATLLHDDVVDESSMRRGRETANHIWGSKASILVGDYLFTQSVQLLLKPHNWQIIEVFAKASHAISTGEVLQLSNVRNVNLTIPAYFEIIRAKTAVLFAAAAEIAALLAGKNPEECTRMYQYGLHLGNAFQLMDDVIDYVGDVHSIGKNLGDDLAEGKLTLPLIHALQQACEEDAAYLKACIEAPAEHDLGDIVAILTKTNSIAFTMDMAKQEVQESIVHLHGVEAGSYKDALVALAEFAIGRAN